MRALSEFVDETFRWVSRAESERGRRVKARIYRFDPTVDKAPRYEDYDVPFHPHMRIIDVLDHVREVLGIDIGYRWFCGVKKCGTCGVMVNGRAKLACWEPAEEEMVLEPLRNLPHIRDLVVDRQPYETKLQEFGPFLNRSNGYAQFPEFIRDEELRPTEHLRDCIQCLCCYAACPVIAQSDTGFAGPVSLVQMALFALDPRDNGMNRAKVAAEKAEVFKCVSCYACESACPAEIPIVSEAIEPIKRLVHEHYPSRRTRHAEVFAGIVQRLGKIDAPLLVMRTRGFTLDGFVGMLTGFRMILKGKVNPLRTCLQRPTPAAEEIRKLFDLLEARKK